MISRTSRGKTVALFGGSIVIGVHNMDIGAIMVRLSESRKMLKVGADYRKPSIINSDVAPIDLIFPSVESIDAMIDSLKLAKKVLKNGK